MNFKNMGNERTGQYHKSGILFWVAEQMINHGGHRLRHSGKAKINSRMTEVLPAFAKLMLRYKRSITILIFLFSYGVED
jgi:hypothetical protein